MRSTASDRSVFHLYIDAGTWNKPRTWTALKSPSGSGKLIHRRSTWNTRSARHPRHRTAPGRHRIGWHPGEVSGRLLRRHRQESNSHLRELATCAGHPIKSFQLTLGALSVGPRSASPKVISHEARIAAVRDKNFATN